MSLSGVYFLPQSVPCTNMVNRKGLLRLTIVERETTPLPLRKKQRFCSGFSFVQFGFRPVLLTAPSTWLVGKHTGGTNTTHV